MTRQAVSIAVAGLVGAAAASAGLGQSSALALVQPGLWEMSGAPASRVPSRQCIADVAALARFEHLAHNCRAKILKDGVATLAIDYSCGAAGFGHSEITVLTPRSLRISTQGISGGLPFNYVLQARRIDDCPKNASLLRH